MSAITTHVLDTSRGRPAIGVEVILQIRSGHEWKQLGAGLTDANGRCNTLTTEGVPLESGTYRLLFNIGPYYHAQHVDTFYAQIPIVFEAPHPETHYHIPLLISPYGYSTYRGT
jgi:5-hydroxyisourate hydrolase